MKAIKTTLSLLVVAVVLGGPRPAGGVGPYTAFAVLIDQSFEMHDNYHNQSKNFIARDVAKRIINNIPTDRPMKGAIYMYGIMAAENKNRVLTVMPWRGFNKDQFLFELGKVDKQDGPSTLSVALRYLKDDILSAGINGWIAVFVISGGNHTDVDDAAQRAKELKQAHPDLCIFPVLVGKSKVGGKNLKEVADKGKCGFQINAESADSGEEVRRYLSLIFQGAPGDTDMDGIPDNADQCPDTPFGARVDPRGCWVINDINFDVNKWDIKPHYYEQLDGIAGVMNANPGLFVLIEGHTDSDGSSESNLELSRKRAESVMNYLISADVDPGRLRAVGKGEDFPVADNATPEGKALNRRIEFKIQKNQPKATPMVAPK
jgi:OOP family OmpA-OmpF porin